jgi:hypothetical protein
MITRRIRFPRPRKTLSEIPTSAEPMDIFERDDGKFSIGFHDDCAGPFESRWHARDAWLRRYSRHSDQWLR